MLLSKLIYVNKKVLLRERKRHTARRLARPRSAALSPDRLVGGGGVTPSSPDWRGIPSSPDGGGVPPSSPGRGGGVPPISQMGVSPHQKGRGIPPVRKDGGIPHLGIGKGICPPPPSGTWSGYPPPSRW